jgi:hypothetical protein
VCGSFVTKLKADVKRNIEYDFKEGVWCFNIYWTWIDYLLNLIVG